MSSIPSDIGASAAQAGYQSEKAAKARDANGQGPAVAGKRGVRAIDEAADTVDTSDSNTQTYTDSEGSGSMGRSFEEAASDDKQQEGVQEDDSGQLHLDLEA